MSSTKPDPINLSNVLTHYVMGVLIAVLAGNRAVEGSAIIADFEGRIGFQMHEDFTQAFDGPHLILSVETGLFATGGYSFPHEVAIEGNQITVWLGRVRPPPPDAMVTQAFSSAWFGFDFPREEGQYILEFRSKNHQDRYIVTVSETQVAIEAQEASFSSGTKVLERVSGDLLWAVCRTGRFYPKGYEHWCRNYFAEVATLGSLLSPTAPEKGTPTIQFYRATANDAELIRLVKKYDRNGFQVRISTGQGKLFYCPHPDRCGPHVGSIPPSRDITYIKDDPSVCEEMGSSGFYRDDCYQAYAMTKRNAAFCKKIQHSGIRSWCLEAVRRGITSRTPPGT